MSEEVNALRGERAIQEEIAQADGLLQRDVTIRTLLESLAEAVVVINPAGRIVLVNPRTETMFGYSSADVLGKDLGLFLPENHKGVHHDHLAAFFSRPRIRPMGSGLELSGRRKDGSVFPVEVSVSFLEVETGKLGLAFITDISARKASEEALKRKNKQLDEFAQVVAHDLNSNVCTIVSICELLNDHDDDFSDEERKEFLSEIAQGGRKMSEIISELLLLARMKKEDVKVAQVDMNPLIRSAINRLQNKINETGAIISQTPIELTALGYAPWIEEVWYNYLSNALQYGGRPPSVEMGCRRDGDFVLYWMRDNGNGIEPDHIPLLFNDQSDARHKIIKGHGLGLSIVRDIVEKMDGSVSATSEVGRGSTFIFRLPAN